MNCDSTEQIEQDTNEYNIDERYLDILQRMDMKQTEKDKILNLLQKELNKPNINTHYVSVLEGLYINSKDKNEEEDPVRKKWGLKKMPEHERLLNLISIELKKPVFNTRYIEVLQKLYNFHIKEYNRTHCQTEVFAR